MNEMRTALDQGLPELGLSLSEEKRETLCAFGQAMVKQNEVMNLTGITEPAAVAKLHLLDSLTVLATADLAGKTLIDVGCGAGFPGVPLAIACPEGKRPTRLLPRRFKAMYGDKTDSISLRYFNSIKNSCGNAITPLHNQSIQTRTSLKGRFLGVFRFIVAYRR